MIVLLDEYDVHATLNALHRAAEDCRKLAANAQANADAGHSDGLVANYAVVAQAFRESANRYQRTHDTIHHQYETHGGSDE